MIVILVREISSTVEFFSNFCSDPDKILRHFRQTHDKINNQENGAVQPVTKSQEAYFVIDRSHDEVFEESICLIVSAGAEVPTSAIHLAVPNCEAVKARCTRSGISSKAFKEIQHEGGTLLNIRGPDNIQIVCVELSASNAATDRTSALAELLVSFYSGGSGKQKQEKIPAEAASESVPSPNARKSKSRTEVNINAESVQAVSVGPSEEELLLQAEAEKEQYRGEYLPTMFASIYSNQVFVPIACNSNKMIPFKTEIFEGHVLLMINSGTSANPYQSRFSGVAAKYRMEIQVQGTGVVCGLVKR